jgi:predicted nucleic acid-binding protein
MVFLDSNIFIIDRFFPRDNNYLMNKKFLERIEKADIKAFLPFYTLLEICGVTSFNLSTEEQKRWLYTFSKVYSVEILDPFEGQTENQTVNDYFLSLTHYILKKMTIGDAIFLKEAEMYNARAIITWNKKHFVDRTDIPVYNPVEYISFKDKTI